MDLSKKVGIIMHGSLLKDIHFVAKDPLKLNNAINTCLIYLNIIWCYEYPNISNINSFIID